MYSALGYCTSAYYICILYYAIFNNYYDNIAPITIYMYNDIIKYGLCYYILGRKKLCIQIVTQVDVFKMM